MLLSTHDVQELVRSNEGLLRRMAELGLHAANVATALVSAGAPAPDAFVQDIADVGRLFVALRTEAFAAASSVGLPLPPLETVNSAQDLSRMLGALLTTVGAIERREAIGHARESALNVLDRVAMLAHVDQREFDPLRLCQERARQLRAVLEQQSSEPDAPTLAPFVALLHFIDAHQQLDDDKWGALQETVTSAFGTALAMAAGRGRLVAKFATPS
jgi:hypothetical protein